MHVAPSAPVGGFYGGPKAATTAVGGCPGGKNIPNTSSFTFTAAGEIKSGSGVCLFARTLYGPQLWAKPLSDGKVAVLVVNLIEDDQTFALPLMDVPGLDCKGSCSVRDVWDRKDLPAAVDGHVPIQLRGHVRCAFSTYIYTRGRHWFPRLLASSEHACGQWHSSGVRSSYQFTL
jgi:hypothetical protein